MADYVRGVNLLQNELDKAKDSLKGVDENIKKLTGRDPAVPNFRQQQRRVSVGNSDRDGKPASTENRLFNLARRGIVQDDPGPRRGRPGGAFSRLGPRPGGRGRDRRQDSGDEEESRDRPTLQSSVIATQRDERSRLNSIEEQSKDRKGQARNRRMFGLLLGTLQKFKDESVESKKKEEQRIEIENKLEEKFKQEKEEIIQERRQLFLERRRKQFRIKLIEQKMEMAQNHEDWERETRKLENFILSKSKPHIFFMPKILTDDSQSKLKDTKLAVDAMIENRREMLEKEIKEMMDQVKDVPHDDDDDESDDSDDSEQGESGEEQRDHRGDGKENHRRERKESGAQSESGKGDGEEHHAKERHVIGERERRDREREERDRDRRMKDKLKEERRREGGGAGRRDRDRSGNREHNKRAHSRSTSRTRDRERRHSSKTHSAKKRRHHDEDGKSKRRSRDESRTTERKNKVWEPMEDEEEEEFVSSKPGTEQDNKPANQDAGSSIQKPANDSVAKIQNKMLEMAGMAEIVGEKAVTEPEHVADEDRSMSGADVPNEREVVERSENADEPMSHPDESEHAEMKSENSESVS